jgi:hypothetical protein
LGSEVNFFTFFSGSPGFDNIDGHIRAHDTADGAVDTIFGPCLIRGKMPFGIYPVSDLQNIFGAEIDTKSAAFVALVINYVLKCHTSYSL